MAAITDEKYVALTTYKKDGSTKSLPVWITDFGDGTIGCTTESSSYKVKRIKNDPRVILQPSNAKGDVKAGTDEVTGTAVVKGGADFERYEAMVKQKYGMMYRGIKLFQKVAGLFGRGASADSVVVITLD